MVVTQFSLTLVMRNQCHFSVAIIMQQRSVIKVKSSSSTVMQSKIHQIHRLQLAVSLPDGEKASSVACLENSVVVLSSSGRVFSSSFESGSSTIRFSQVSELEECEIVWLSGTDKHCLVVSKEGRVFGRGSNKFGQLGLGEETESVSSFTEISSLLGYKIRAAYAGCSHSLFETREGKILSCCDNMCGQLFLSSGLKEENVYSPRETTITDGAIFCIAGANNSSVFVGCNPPPNTPNMPIHYH